MNTRYFEWSNDDDSEDNYDDVRDDGVDDNRVTLIYLKIETEPFRRNL